MTTYSSSNPAIASVSPTGLVRGVAAGTASIAVTHMGFTATSQITVSGTPPPISGMVNLPQLATGLYLNRYQGGLYAGGVNTMPADHNTAGLAAAALVTPRNSSGAPSATGKIGLISIGMSNTRNEWNGGETSTAPGSFTGLARASSAVNNDQVTIINGAQGSQPAESWATANAEPWGVLQTRLAAAGISANQVQVAWLKQALSSTDPTLETGGANADALTLEKHLGSILRIAKTKYPNLRLVFISSRIYGGYSTNNRHVEPDAYEGGLAVKWLIDAQINQMRNGTTDPVAGNLNNASVAPWIAWGPYIWAKGPTANADGLSWIASDFLSDGVHPNATGSTKVGSRLLSHFLNSPYTAWFRNSGGGGGGTLPQGVNSIAVVGPGPAAGAADGYRRIVELNHLEQRLWRVTPDQAQGRGVTGGAWTGGSPQWNEYSYDTQGGFIHNLSSTTNVYWAATNRRFLAHHAALGSPAAKAAWLMVAESPGLPSPRPISDIITNIRQTINNIRSKLGVSNLPVYVSPWISLSPSTLCNTIDTSAAVAQFLANPGIANVHAGPILGPLTAATASSPVYITAPNLCHASDDTNAGITITSATRHPNGKDDVVGPQLVSFFNQS